MLNPWPLERLCEPDGRPYWIWDVPMTLERFRALLDDPDPNVRDYWLATLMREARPDDVFHFADSARMRDALSRVEHILGRKREFWAWYLGELERRGQ